MIGLFASGGMLFQNDGLQFTAASTSAFLTQLYAILIPIWVGWRTRRNPGAVVWTSCALVLAGVAILGQFDWRDWAKESERVKLVEDADGDGKADVWSVFAEGFRTAETGTAAGVAVRGDDVWFACIPDLWRFRGGTGKQAASSNA